MAELLESPTAPVDLTEEPPRQRLRQRVVLALTALLVTLALTAAALWWIGYRASLEVIAHVGPPQCEGTTVTTSRDAAELGGVDFPETAIPVRPGFVCTVPIKVENHSDHEVTVQRVTLGGGPDSGSAYRVEYVGGQQVSGEEADGGGADAIAELDQVLAPGEDEVIDVRLVFRKSACMGEGAGEQTWPRIRIADQLARHDVVVGGFPRLEGTADADCPRERTP